MRPLLAHRWAVHAVAFAPDEPRRLATGGTDRVIRVWDTLTGEVVSELRHPSLGEVRHLAWTADGTALVGADRVGHLLRWQRADEAVTLQRVQPGHGVRGFALLDATRIVLGAGGTGDRPGGPGFLTSWHLDTCVVRQETWPAAVHELAWSAQAGILALAEEGRSVHLIEWLTPARRRRTLTFPHEVAALRIVNGAQLVLAHGCLLELWDVATLQRQRQLTGHRSTVTCLAVSADGRLLLSGSRDRTVRVWTLPDGGAVAGYQWEVGPVLDVAIAPDGQTAAACGEKALVLVWDLDG